jgi:hypothetical protein
VNTRNPDLPILDELGAEFEAMISAAWGAEGDEVSTKDPETTTLSADALADSTGPIDPAPSDDPDRHTARRRLPTTPSRATRERRSQAGRIGRRATILLVLVCLVGGVAFAALRGGGSSGHGHTAPTLLGRAGDGAWSFSAYRDEGRLCTVFVPRDGELNGSCGDSPSAGHVRAGSAVADGHRYVFGVAGPGVARASASLAETGATRADRITGDAVVHPPLDRTAADEAGFPTGDGWFVFDLGPVRATGQAAAPAVVTPFAATGHRAGPAYVDCSLGVIGPACKRRIEAAAAGK